jgi:hypothetical protein
MIQFAPQSNCEDDRVNHRPAICRPLHTVARDQSLIIGGLAMAQHSVAPSDNSINVIPCSQLEGSPDAYKLNGDFLVSFAMWGMINSASSQHEMRQVLDNIPVIDLDEMPSIEEMQEELCFS